MQSGFPAPHFSWEAGVASPWGNASTPLSASFFPKGFAAEKCNLLFYIAQQEVHAPAAEKKEGA